VPFRPLPDAELDRLDDDALVAYLREATAAGDRDAARRALEVLVFGFWSLVALRVRLRLPAHAVEDVTAEVLVQAITSSFDGRSVGEFRSWLNTILRRTVADWYRAQARQVEQAPLAGGGEDDVAVAEPSIADETGYVEVQLLVERVLGELSAPHRRVVELLVFEDRPAADAVAELPGMTEANAYQVVKRFRARLRALLEGREGDHG